MAVFRQLLPCLATKGVAAARVLCNASHRHLAHWRQLVILAVLAPVASDLLAQDHDNAAMESDIRRAALVAFSRNKIILSSTEHEFKEGLKDWTHRRDELQQASKDLVGVGLFGNPSELKPSLTLSADALARLEALRDASEAKCKESDDAVQALDAQPQVIDLYLRKTHAQIACYILKWMLRNATLERQMDSAIESYLMTGSW